jgi:hypothetical protein
MEITSNIYLNKKKSKSFLIKIPIPERSEGSHAKGIPLG